MIKLVSHDNIITWLNDTGERHRKDGPAIIYPDGSEEWCINGKFHREDGPAIICPDGRQSFYINGKLHREDGPAMIFPNGEQHWCIDGKRHREDGPAIIYPYGEQSWYINGHDITDEIQKWAKDRDIDLENLSEMDKMIIQLEWGNYGK